MIRVFCLVRRPLLRQNPRTILRNASNSAAIQRVDVVNEELCENALDLLRPSLESYHGCKVIDILPGAGVWSRKVHELLQPRSHVVIDFPSIAGRKNESSRLSEIKGPHFEYHILPDFNDKFFLKPSFTQLLQKLATSSQPVLVLANFTNIKGLKRRLSNNDRLVRSVSPANSFMMNFIEQVREGTGIHSAGHARLLLWTLDRDKFNFLNKSVSSRGFMNIDIEEMFFPQEVVGCAHPTRKRRPASLELQSALRTARKMASNNLELPRDRRSALHGVVLEDIHQEEGPNNLAAQLLELDQLEIRWAFDHFARNEQKSNASNKRAMPVTPEFSRRIFLREYFDNLIGAPIPKRNMYPARDEGQQTAACQTILEDLDRSIATDHAQSPFVETTQGSSTSRDFVLQIKPNFGPYTRSDVKKRLDSLTSMLDRDNTSLSRRLLDESRALKVETPLLAWDQRPFEPLECQPNDFAPAHKLALLDFQPRPRNATSPPLQTIPIVRWLKPMLAFSIPEALDAVGNGAAAAILPLCPTIRDPVAGGAVDERDVRVRMLTEAMWREIVEAWYRWPFRKSDEEILADVGFVELLPEES